MSYMFDDVVETGIKSSDISPAVAYLKDNMTECSKEYKAVERLLNRAAHTDSYDHIEQILTILRTSSFLFDSIDYTNGLRELILNGRIIFAKDMLEYLISGKGSLNVSSIQKLIQLVFNEGYKKEGSSLVISLLDSNKTESMDFIVKVLSCLRESDMFDQYRDIIHRRLNSLELWGYYVEYCVETERITEVLESLKYFRNHRTITSQVVALYNKLAANQIRFTIYKNQQDLPDDELEQIMENFEDGDMTVRDSVLDQYSKLCKNFEETESRFINGVEIFNQVLEINSGQANYNATQIYLRSLLKYHREVVNDSSTIISFEDIMDFEEIEAIIKVEEEAKPLDFDFIDIAEIEEHKQSQGS